MAQTLDPQPFSAGDTPLAALPQYGGAGGSQQAAQYYAGQAFFKLFGRNPTQAELTMLTPAYMSGDPNIAATAVGDSTVAQYYQQQKNSPETKQKQATETAPQFFDQVSQAFKTAIGRDPTDAEKSHFGTLLATKDLDTYTLSQFLQQTPEAQNAADKSFREGLTNDLQGQDERYYKEKVLPAITQQFAQSGRSVDSSGYAAMLAKAAQEQNTTREGFLSNLTASQYGNNKGNATSDYQKLLEQYYGNQNYGRQRSDYLTDAYTKRLTDLQDYQIQQQAYDKYLRNYGKRSGGVAGGVSGFLTGGTSGALVGSKFGPWGALGGGLLGGGLGAFGGSQSQY